MDGGSMFRNGTLCSNQRQRDEGPTALALPGALLYYRTEPDISTWETTGHFKVVLTRQSPPRVHIPAWWRYEKSALNCLRAPKKSKTKDKHVHTASQASAVG